MARPVIGDGDKAERQLRATLLHVFLGGHNHHQLVRDDKNDGRCKSNNNAFVPRPTSLRPRHKATNYEAFLQSVTSSPPCKSGFTSTACERSSGPAAFGLATEK